jgi:Flp pilus assembly protein TadD
MKNNVLVMGLSVTKYFRILFFIAFIFALSSCALPNTKQSVKKTPSLDETLKARLLVDKGALALKNHMLTEAVAAFRMARNLSPIAASWDGLGCVALMRGELPRAEKLFRRAMKVDPTYHHVYSNLAILEIAKGDKRKAQEYFEHSLKWDRLNYKARANYSILLSTQGAPGALEMAEEAHALGNKPKTMQIMKLIKENQR